MKVGLKVWLEPEDQVLMKLWTLREKLKRRRMWDLAVEVLEIESIVEKIVEELKNLKRRHAAQNQHQRFHLAAGVEAP